METLEDIVLKSNQYYDAQKEVFTHIIPSEGSTETVEEPVIVMDSLHFCFSHAVMNCCFPIFWIIDDLKKVGELRDAKIRVFIKDTYIVPHPMLYLPIIDERNKTYRGVFKDIIELISPFPVIFQHALYSNYFFKKCIFYPDNDKTQRTPWNCVDYYPEWNIPKEEIRFSDEIIYSKLSLFRNVVLTKFCIEIPDVSENCLMIIDRKYNRKIEPMKLQSLVEEAKTNRGWNFTSVVLLEDKSFQEQVQLFAKHRIFILRHGSSLINLLWIPNNSIVFELQGGSEGVVSPMVIPRICKLTNSKHILLKYDDYDCKKDIFDTLYTILHQKVITSSEQEQSSLESSLASLQEQ